MVCELYLNKAPSIMSYTLQTAQVIFEQLYL